MTARPARRIVALRALGLGDVLTAVPALRALRRRHPEAELVLAAPSWIGPLVTPALADRVVHVDLRAGGGPAPEQDPLPESLAGADLAVNLHGAGPQSSRLLLGTEPGGLLAYAHPDVPATDRGPAWDADDHEVLRWCRLLRWYGWTCDAQDLDIEVDPAPAVPAAAGATLLHPGAAQAARRWPAERWSAVARGEQVRGRRVVVTAGPGEEELAAAVAAGAGLDADAVLAGLDLAALAATVASAGQVVVGDTGVAHLAVAVGAPSVALFGPTSPRRWGPPPQRPWHQVLWHGENSPPGDPHAGAADPALLAISVEEVLQALAAQAPRAATAPATGARPW